MRACWKDLIGEPERNHVLFVRHDNSYSKNQKRWRNRQICRKGTSAQNLSPQPEDSIYAYRYTWDSPHTRATVASGWISGSGVGPAPS
ncbi:hypothetical protein PROAA_2050003 [Candidatus Propionivibrio aalborgensis]|uniref:Uncharacterized protein n=1 Tax=Candidatus Propionivibrio aalborgensis TaxID=1860101 RepID=A0A1A8XPB9_9RHOO|nr:hypothetical protein PROAA_2050003 [Candidatus Propionivibrio aalborgensis]